MKETGSLKDVAELFDIAPSALRYWDERGLIRFQRGENRYRIPGVQTLLDVSDVLFFRSLSLSLEDIARLPSLDAAALEHLLDTTRTNLQEKMKALEDSMERIAHKQTLLRRLEQLETAPFVEEEAALPPVYVFDMRTGEMVREYVKSPHLATIHFSPVSTAVRDYGFAGIGKTLIFPADTVPRLYLKGLLSVVSDDDSKHNAAAFYAAAKTMGYIPGDLTGFFLASLRNEQQYDFYEGWLTLLPKDELRSGGVSDTSAALNSLL